MGSAWMRNPEIAPPNSATLVSDSIPQRKYHQTMVSTMVSKRYEMDFVHPQQGSPAQNGASVKRLPSKSFSGERGGGGRVEFYGNQGGSALSQPGWASPQPNGLGFIP